MQNLLKWEEKYLQGRKWLWLMQKQPLQGSKIKRLNNKLNKLNKTLLTQKALIILSKIQ